MTAETTLGGRILWAATNWEAIRAEDGVMAGREEYEDLRALCGIADAAERLAVAVEWCDENGWSFTSERYNEYHEALAAWWALGEVQP